MDLQDGVPPFAVENLPSKCTFSYFSKGNNLNKHILIQERSLIKYLGDRWTSLPQDKKDLLVDFLLVDDEIRHHHQQAHTESNSYAHSLGSSCIQESFPRLNLNSGQKINVDFESDLWTWRDEHSGPFSWYSKSQQDLSLIDLEPENISKPQPKSFRGETDEEDVKIAAPQFTHPSSCWCQDVIGEYRKHEQEISVSPSTSINFSTYNSKVELISQEVNPAFDLGDEKDLVVDSDNIYGTSNEVQEKAKGKLKEKSRRSRSRSPSPKKILRTGSLSKTGSKSSSTNLINSSDIDGEDANNAFNNPAMESEWSNFVGEDHKEGKTDKQTESANVMHTAPQHLFIDRGESTAYPYISDSHFPGDKDELIKSQLPTSGTVTVTSCIRTNSQEWSEESSPDHTTYLLKGTESPATVDIKMDKPDWQEASPPEEILSVNIGSKGEVAVTSTEVKIPTAQAESMEPSTALTGFDFLDNW